MDPKPVVLYISSDEEGWGETRGGGGGSGGGGSGDDDLDWITELLGGDADDSDDVVLVGEVVANPKKRLNKSSVKDLDDDCVVLDGDPDKPVAIDSDKAGDSDDLLIVGEKGQIACRDYPHSRHLCAKFPFASTPHEKHCDLCHCYVCDSHAPCVDWGTGTSSIDHCHATDKVEFWKLQRKSLKNGDRAPLPVTKHRDTYQSVGLSQMKQVPPLTLPPLVQNQVSTSTTVRACSATNYSIPTMNQGRSQRPGYVVPRTKFQPHLVSRQLHGARNNIFRKDRRHGIGNLGPQFLPSNTMTKRTGPVGVSSATNNSGYGSSNNNYGSQYSRNPCPVATSNDKDPFGWQDFYSGMTSGSKACWSSSQQNSSILANPVPSRPQVSSQPNMGSTFVNSVLSQPQVSSPPNMDNIFVNPLPCQPDASSQPSIDSIFADSLPSQPQVSSQPTVDSIFANSANLSQPQAYYQPIPVSNDNLDGCQQGDQTPSALDSSFSGFDSRWVTPTSHSNQQPPVENSYLPSSEAMYNLPLTTEFNPDFPVSSIPDSIDFQLNHWILEDQSVSAHPGLNILSPEPAPIDTGNLFDF